MSNLEDIKAKFALKLAAEKQKIQDKADAKIEKLESQINEKVDQKERSIKAKAQTSSFEKLNKLFTNEKKPLPRDFLLSVVANLESDKVSETIAICNKLLQEKEA